MATERPQSSEKHKLTLETAEIAWSELQRHFASGRLISIHPDLDLVDVAFSFSEDDRVQIKLWLDSQRLHPVTDNQASQWHEEQASPWAVVVRPWVLVQDRDRC